MPEALPPPDVRQDEALCPAEEPADALKEPVLCVCVFSTPCVQLSRCKRTRSLRSHPLT